MFKFDRQQKIFLIGNIEVGGQPGELPTLLIGTMFYQGDKIVTDEKKGEFNKQKAEELIQKQEELSEKTGNPALIDIVGLNSEAICKYVDFVSDFTDTPISIYSYQSSVMIPAIRYCAEIGLSDRIIYNHIAYFTKEEEIKSIKEAKIKSAVIYAFNLSNQRPAGRVEILYGTSQQESLLNIAQRSGIENFLVDGAACDIPGVGLTAKAIHLIKEEFGLPAGGAPYRQLTQWGKLKEYGTEAKNACMAGCIAALQKAGANFIYYGPIIYAHMIFPVAAMVDAMTAYGMRMEGVKTRTKNHPLYKIF